MKLLKDGYASLESYQQKIVWVILYIVFTFVCYTFVWSPKVTELDMQQQRVSSAEDDLRWLLRKSAEVHALGGGKSAALRSMLDTSLDQFRLRPTKKNFDPRSGEWQLHFTAVDFRELLLWLNRLRRDSLATIVSADINRLSAGRVQVQLILTEC